ncbi:hypothetical protein EG328_011637 [Venturia inaequalis]|uniref:Uncharacterized protein n=1 Tax=Venturia inaequalis TaxID=5025 RepID=A0A8H3VJY8_VENIN|nr:hypothetical protein EG328_011637 [Venturia inaequalis]KAE9994467.1 hypothetical protein EG327_009145 [Venturia inaequalis]RDI86204.1 hypothetical protein Vi05172_g3925 [Venturia inaequalis]
MSKPENACLNGSIIRVCPQCAGHPTGSDLRNKTCTYCRGQGIIGEYCAGCASCTPLAQSHPSPVAKA